MNPISRSRGLRDTAALCVLVASVALAGMQDASAGKYSIEDAYSDIAHSYRQRQSGLYSVQLDLLYRHIQQASPEHVLHLAGRLASLCEKQSCDGLQPAALALADRLAVTDLVTDADANGALRSIFRTGLFPLNYPRKLRMPVWNPHSRFNRMLLPDAVHAMFNRRVSLVEQGTGGKVTTDALLNMVEMQRDFCRVGLLPDATGGGVRGKNRSRRAACDELGPDAACVSGNGCGV